MKCLDPTVLECFQGFRHSTSSRFVVYDLGNTGYHDINGGELLQLVRLQPNGDGLVYVHDNDIYFRPHFAIDIEIQLTFTGVPGVVYNGVPDWVYEGK